MVEASVASFKFPIGVSADKAPGVVEAMTRKVSLGEYSNLSLLPKSNDVVEHDYVSLLCLVLIDKL
jgi:hypothetical protein